MPTTREQPEPFTMPAHGTIGRRSPLLEPPAKKVMGEGVAEVRGLSRERRRGR
jgi:hypothetical protein